MTDETTIEHGSTNVYVDLGRPDADGMLVKAQLATRIGDIIKHRQLTQVEAAEIVGMPQPKLSGLLRGQFRGISEAKMLNCLVRLGHDVTIIVGAAGGSPGRGISTSCPADETPPALAQRQAGLAPRSGGGRGVLHGIGLVGFSGVVLGVQVMAVRGMRVLRGLVVLAVVDRLRRVAMVLRGFLVVLGSLLVMGRDIFVVSFVVRHCGAPSVQTDCPHPADRRRRGIVPAIGDDVLSRASLSQ